MITDLNNFTLTCYSADEVIACYEALRNHKMIPEILKVTPLFDSDENYLLI